MLKQETLVRETAEYKRDARRLFDAHLASLLALAWPFHKEKGFSFEINEDLMVAAYDDCIQLSDECAEQAEKRYLTTIVNLGDTVDEEAVWKNIYNDSVVESFDMAGTHLLDLLTAWIGVAAANEWTKDYTRIMIGRYLSNPYLCPQWNTVPRDLLAWGAGYAKDISEQLALIGQNLIVQASRYAEWLDESAQGATYYILRRGSTYDCGVCDEMCNVPIPITEGWTPPHARCLCYAEYHYEPLPIE